MVGTWSFQMGGEAPPFAARLLRMLHISEASGMVEMSAFCCIASGTADISFVQTLGGRTTAGTAAGYPPVPSGWAGPCFGIPAPVRRRHDRGGQHPPPDLNTGPGSKMIPGPSLLPFGLILGINNLPITMYLRLKARQPAVSFSASLPKLLE